MYFAEHSKVQKIAELLLIYVYIEKFGFHRFSSAQNYTLDFQISSEFI